MGSTFATVTEEDGVVARSACVNGSIFAELRFPAGYVQDAFDPDRPYLAFVLDGRLEKCFRLRTMELDAACAVTMPAGATHGARFGSEGARILIVKPSGGARRLSRPARRAARPRRDLACLATCGRASRIRRRRAARSRGAGPRAPRRDEPRGVAPSGARAGRRPGSARPKSSSASERAIASACSRSRRRSAFTRRISRASSAPTSASRSASTAGGSGSRGRPRRSPGATRRST